MLRITLLRTNVLTPFEAFFAATATCTSVEFTCIYLGSHIVTFALLLILASDNGSNLFKSIIEMDMASRSLLADTNFAFLKLIRTLI